MLKFKDTITEALSKGECPKGVGADLVAAARRKIKMIEAAGALNDLRVPPVNGLHPQRRPRRPARHQGQR